MSAETIDEEPQKNCKKLQTMRCNETMMFILGNVAVESLFTKKWGVAMLQKSESVVFVDEPIVERRRKQFDHPSTFEWCRGGMSVSWKGRKGTEITNPKAFGP